MIDTSAKLLLDESKVVPDEEKELTLYETRKEAL